MRVAQGSKLTFTTTSDDYAAIVLGPNGVETPVVAGEVLPTDVVGFYTLSVTDRQLRKHKVTLKGTPPFATPPEEWREGVHIVLVPYEVF